ncbi:MAG: preprotein translocase subunit YajC [Acidobacteria bacterium]|nr:preprotein translocase subunit YajC [Acidobacteriota bacterium]
MSLLAQAPAQQAPAYGPMFGLLPIILILVIFYFLLILPTRRRQKAHDAMVQALVAGDRIVTSGGLIGTVVKADEKTLKVRVAQGVEVTLLRSHVSGKAAEETTP